MKILKKLLLCLVAFGAVFGALNVHATGAEGHGVDKGKSPVKGGF